MSLRLWYEASPDIQVLHCPLIWAGQENVVRHDVVISKCRHDGYLEGLCGVLLVVAIPKDVGQLLHHELVLRDDLILGARQLLVVVVSCRVAGPHHKINVVGHIVLYPVHGRVDEGRGRVACRCFGAVVACRAIFAVACSLLLGARVCLVVGVGMEVCTMMVRGAVAAADTERGLSTSYVEEASSQRAALATGRCSDRTCA